MWLYKLTLALTPLARRYWTLRLDGAVDAIPDTGPLILCGNHTSFLDPYILGFVFPRPIRYLITRDWYDKSSFWRAIFRASYTLPVERGLEASVESVCRALADGEIVGIYPEGRISHDGRIQRFRSGICYFAARSGVPVVPFGVRGLFESLPRTRRVPRRSAITITLGRPMHFPGSPVRDPGAAAIRSFRDDLFREVCRLSDQPPHAMSARPADRLRNSSAVTTRHLCAGSPGRSDAR